MKKRSHERKGVNFTPLKGTEELCFASMLAYVRKCVAILVVEASSALLTCIVEYRRMSELRRLIDYIENRDPIRLCLQNLSFKR